MVKIQYAVPLFALALALSCTKQNHQAQQQLPMPASPPASPLSFETTVFERADGVCQGDTTPCFTIRVQYPSAVAGSDTVRLAINTALSHYVYSSLAGHLADTTKRSQSLDSLAAVLCAEYRNFVQETGDDGFVTPWEITIGGKVLHKSASAITIELSTYSYMGGAHPNYWITYQNFYPSSGALLSLAEIAEDSVQLSALAEQEFRRSQNLTPHEDLEKAGYWFDNNVFSLPRNFALTHKGLLFLYNPYEVASYAQGPIEVLIPYSRLQGILKKEYL